MSNLAAQAAHALLARQWRLTHRAALEHDLLPRAGC